RFSILPAITPDGIITYDIIEGPVDSQCFMIFGGTCGMSSWFVCAVLTYISLVQMPLTNPVIIIDNCNIHKTEEVCALIKDMHCTYNTLFFTC
ncbi:hypothetical protein BS17DRAFT_690797, partial [Gyrodon lividus]